MSKLSAANVHKAFEVLRGIYGGGLTFRMLDPGDRFRFTRNEAIVLDNIARNSYSPVNYGRPESYNETGSIWSRYILDSGSSAKVPVKSLPGICSSLAKKGLVDTVDDGKDSTIGLTPAGYEAWLATDLAKADAALPSEWSEPKEAK